MSSLLSKLQLNYPQWSFKPGDHFAWSRSDQTIYYGNDEDPAQLLHEVGHATLSHSSYSRDIELLVMEREAWDAAAEQIAPTYGVTIDDDTIQDNLDTYRDWLHARSLCPSCSSVGYQTKQSTYTCPACNSSWLVNEARTCGLRRHKL